MSRKSRSTEAAFVDKPLFFHYFVLTMTLTLNQALLIILTVAAVVAAVFLVRLFAQLRRTAAEGEKALAEFAELARHLKELDLVVKEQVEELAKTISASKAGGGQCRRSLVPHHVQVRSTAVQISSLILPVARFLWRQVGKRKKERAHAVMKEKAASSKSPYPF
ncbi:MAG: hypothetical protein MZV63_25890 [Marinilabiliales bacterium]|nr:hypothetical protein [Marinilabiliales bacterium]